VKLQRLLVLQSNNSIKKTKKDYILIKKCDVLNVTVEGITVKKLVKKRKSSAKSQKKKAIKSGKKRKSQRKSKKEIHHNFSNI
jgi:phage protein D